MQKQEFIHISAHTGALIRKTREEKGLSRMNLAEAIEASPQQIECYENGDYDIAIDRLFRIGEQLGIPVAKLFD